jgi:GntR family transcriptional regulator, glc operon transcriptional activator
VALYSAQLSAEHSGAVVQPSVSSRRQVDDIVAERIEQLILDGSLKVGQALPSERRLCETLGISRSSLREGLKVLRGRGIVETTQGRGTFIARLIDSQAEKPLMHLFSAHPRTIYDVLDVRALLEGEAARLAALHGSGADFALITRHYREMADAERMSDVDNFDPVAHARIDHAFHRVVCEASHNPVLVLTLRSLSDLILTSVFACIKNLYHRPAHKSRMDAQHARLYHAIIEREADEAKAAAIEHLHGLRDSLREIEREELRIERSTLRLEGWN